MQKIIHYPNLQTVLMVEQILKKEKDITRTELKKKLPKKIMHQTLNVIISYLEESGKVIDHKKGILWTHNDDPKFRKFVEESVYAPELFRKLNDTYHKTYPDAKMRGKDQILSRGAKRISIHQYKKKPIQKPLGRN